MSRSEPMHVRTMSTSYALFTFHLVCLIFDISLNILEKVTEAHFVESQMRANVFFFFHFEVLAFAFV